MLLSIAAVLTCATLDPQRRADFAYGYDACHEDLGMHAFVARFECVDEPYVLNEGIVTVRPRALSSEVVCPRVTFTVYDRGHAPGAAAHP